MNAPNELGLYNKFLVLRTDGRHEAGEKHAACEHFVLDITHDKHALPALAAYANSCKDDLPALANDLRVKLVAMSQANDRFVNIPETTLPNGTIVQAFQVGQFLCSQGPMEMLQVTAGGAPWVDINYHDARTSCQFAGLRLVTELQMLAIAYDIANQDINWTGGTVGQGDIFQGLRKDNVDEPQPADYVPEDADERRWHQLSNGERIYDFSGNAFTWVFDDVQGDENGIVARAITADSSSLSTAPFPSMERGTGWRPTAPANWSGRALVRGGYWNSSGLAGVFRLGIGWPDYAGGSVGFRCTKPA